MAKEVKVGSKELVVINWNVNGLRDEVCSQLAGFMFQYRPHIMCLNETKKSGDKLKPLFSQLGDYVAIINAHNPPHHHGVVMLIRKDVPFKRIDVKLKCGLRSDMKGDDATCGRLIAVDVADQLYVVATYSPNSGVRGLEKLEYRVKCWDNALFNVLEQMRAIQHTLWIGDINVAFYDIDVTNPIAMKDWAGFTPQERESIFRLFKVGGWVDIWRQQHPGVKSYTWRGKKSGLRLDNVIITPGLVSRIIDSFHIEWSPISDHIPIGVKLLLK